MSGDRVPVGIRAYAVSRDELHLGMLEGGVRRMKLVTDKIKDSLRLPRGLGLRLTRPAIDWQKLGAPTAGGMAPGGCMKPAGSISVYLMHLSHVKMGGSNFSETVGIVQPLESQSISILSQPC